MAYTRFFALLSVACAVRLHFCRISELPDATILAVPGAAPKQSYTRTEVLRMLDMTERQLQSWERCGLVEPLDSFAIPDVAVLQNLRELTNRHISLASIRKAVASVRKRMADVGEPLKHVKWVADGRRLRVEIGGQRIEPASGQLVLDFDAATLTRLVAFPTASKAAARRSQRESAEAWFQKGLELEQSAAPIHDIIEAYEKAVELDPMSAGAWLNLGTIYFNARMWVQAERYYRRALSADGRYPLAHFNLANLYDERGDWARALEHYGKAIELNPTYADAHYNIALLYQNRGRVLDAVRHWRAYLKLDVQSEWATIARRELEKLKQSTVVEGRSRIKVVGEPE